MLAVVGTPQGSTEAAGLVPAEVRGSDHLELDGVAEGVSQHVGDGNQTQDFSKSNKCS